MRNDRPRLTLFDDGPIFINVTGHGVCLMTLKQVMDDLHSTAEAIYVGAIDRRDVDDVANNYYLIEQGCAPVLIEAKHSYRDGAVAIALCREGESDPIRDKNGPFVASHFLPDC